MPQLDFFNLLSQIEFGILVFFSFYIFIVFIVIPTILSIFVVRAFYKDFPLQIFNSFSNLIFFYIMNANFTVLAFLEEFNENFFILEAFEYYNWYIFQEFTFDSISEELLAKIKTLVFL